LECGAQRRFRFQRQDRKTPAGIDVRGSDFKQRDHLRSIITGTYVIRS
jgi:hypothetical protein